MLNQTSPPFIFSPPSFSSFYFLSPLSPPPPPPPTLAMAGETTAAESTPAPAENGRTEETPQTQAQLPKIGNFLGRHRLSAAIGRLNQEIQSLKSELEELDMMEPSSAACKEVLSSMEGKPDALLPITKGPENSAWERWFQPVRSSRNRKWWNSKDPDFS